MHILYIHFGQNDERDKTIYWKLSVGFIDTDKKYCQHSVQMQLLLYKQITSNERMCRANTERTV